MTTAEALDAFVLAHQAHGPIRAACEPVTGEGYTVWAACDGCGETWAQWVTLAVVEAEEQAGDR